MTSSASASIPWHIRVRQSRRASLLLFAVATGALLVAVVWFTRARSDLAEAYAQVGSRHQALAAAQQRSQEARLRVQLADGAKVLVRRAQSGGFVQDNWGERLINISQTPLVRDEINPLLGGVTRNSERIFGAEAFELSVTRADEGLFDTTDPRSPPLMLSLRGTLLFRTQAMPAAPAILTEAP